MRVLACATSILALSTSVLASLIFSRYWEGPPNTGQIIVASVLAVPACSALWMLFSGLAKKNPKLVLGTSSALLMLGLLAIGFWWIVGGACDLALWLHPHTRCIYL